MTVLTSHPSADWAEVCRWVAENRPDLDEQLRDGLVDDDGR